MGEALPHGTEAAPPGEPNVLVAAWGLRWACRTAGEGSGLARLSAACMAQDQLSIYEHVFTHSQQYIDLNWPSACSLVRGLA